MSTSGSAGVPSSGMVDTSGLDLKTAFMLWGIVMGFLAALVLLRVGCNVCIDIVILQDSDSLRKTLSDLRRAIFPNWHPRTQPQDVSQQQQQQRATGGSRDLEGGGGGGSSSNGVVELMNMDRVLSGLTPQQKQDLLISILPTKTVTEKDLDYWKSLQHPSSSSAAASKHPAAIIPSQQHSPDGMERGESSSVCSSSSGCGCADDDGASRQSSDVRSTTGSSHGVICPICIHDMEVGHEVVVLTGCNHIFHRDCLCQWLSTHTRDCPYCRAEIITQGMMEQAYQSRNQRTEA